MIRLPTLPANLDRRQALHLASIVVLAGGFVVMALPDVLSDVRYARSGVAVLTALALGAFYWTGKKE